MIGLLEIVGPPLKESKTAGIIADWAAQLDQLLLRLPEGIRSPSLPPNARVVEDGTALEAPPTQLLLTLRSDITYPEDYLKRMQQHFDELALARKVVGVEGTIYSDFFDGDPAGRRVLALDAASDRFRVVNQLSFGTTLCHVEDWPTVSLTDVPSQFRDVSTALQQYRSGVPLIAIPRAARWLSSSQSNSTEDAAQARKPWPSAVIAQVHEFGGYGKLAIEAVRLLESLGG